MKKPIFLLATLLGTGLCAAAPQGPDYSKTNRPPKAERLFTSTAVEQQIERVKAAITVEKLAWMFENCFPNTLDTTVHYRKDSEGKDDTFVYTGDIHAMWLRDSGAQVWPYLPYAAEDEELRHMIAGVIRRQINSILIDPYANAFNDGATGTGWQDDWTDMKPELHERKWELDSPCYMIRLAYGYWKATGDTSIFDEKWVEAMNKIYQTLREQQRKEGLGPYHFQRVTEGANDTQLNGGYGNPVKPVGLVASAFRPSDDATFLPFLVPSNFFAVTSLHKATEILLHVNRNEHLSMKCTLLAAEIEMMLQKYAIYNHPEFGPIYAFEVDGFGNHLLMDDANVPSLLAMAYLGDVDPTDSVYQNTRRFVWSESNPYFFRGTAIEGIGGPHIGFDMVWPMSLMMKAFTSTDDAEIKWCIETLVNTDAGTGFMHESIHKDNPAKFTRPWFAWQNSLFGELIIKLVNEGKADLLNSIEVKCPPLTIAKFEVDPQDSQQVNHIFESVAPLQVAYNNWAEEYPYAPQVTARMFHTGELLFVRFDVSEQYTAAAVTQDQGKVWTDSCAEFFLALDDTGYYNFETNCIGAMLLAFRKERPAPDYAPEEILQTVSRMTTLAREPFVERTGDNRWSLTLAIPPKALFHHGITSWSGLQARINLYKCGDNLSHPHFLSWKPIDTPTPDFHRPEFFAPVVFA